jgi:hypothetical protein
VIRLMSTATSTAHLVGEIDVGDFGSECVVIGDLDRDGAPDLLFVQCLYGTREITCLTATAISGEVLWQHGAPSPDNGRVYCDLPAHVYDWDNDGRNEVLYVRQARYAELHDPGLLHRERAKSYEGPAMMVVLDGLTGEEERTFPIPAPADDCFLFADLTGRGRREDLVVKDRYWNMWGVSAQGEVLWHYEGSVGHFPAYGDVDNDGRDEIFVGFALIDHDGKVLFEKDAGGHHQDACYVVQLPDGSWRLLFGNHGVHCLAVDGSELWHHSLAEAQHVVASRFRPDLGPVQFAVMDRGQPRAGSERAPAMLYIYDLDGREIWRREQPQGSWAAACVEIDWSGAGEPREVLVYGRGPAQPVAVYNGEGEIIDTMAMHDATGRSEEDRSAHFYCTRADVWGDGRHEVILLGSRGACIWANPRPLSIPTLYNSTLYPGM